MRMTEHQLKRMIREVLSQGATNVPVYTAFVYISRTRYRGLYAECDDVQDLVQELKDGDPSATQESAEVLAGHPSLQKFQGVVVPAPRSSAGRHSLSSFAQDLVDLGVGERVEVPVVRHTPTESSRLRRREGLAGVPAAEHLRTMGLDEHGIDPNEDVLIVDDVVTTGATINSIAQVLRDGGHRGKIIGAAVASTEPNPSENPCRIKYPQ